MTEKIQPFENPQNPNSASITYTLDPELKIDFLTACQENDTDYSKVLRQATKDYLEKNQKKIRNPKSNFLKSLFSNGK